MILEAKKCTIGPQPSANTAAKRQRSREGKGQDKRRMMTKAGGLQGQGQDEASIWGRKRDRMRVGDKKCRLQLEVGNRDMTRVEDTKCRRRIGAGTE
eukprot:scaffold46175_cov14-Tisochrysis_lutea.AAC.1